MVHEHLALLDPADLKQRRRWNTLQIMVARQSKLMLTLATKLRLLPTKEAAEVRMGPFRLYTRDQPQSGSMPWIE